MAVEGATAGRYVQALRLAEWLALALGGVLLALRLATPDPRIGDDDFQVFYAGAAASAAAGSPYVGDFVSPPWFALALVPLTLLPLPLARGVWLGLNLALLLGATVACARLVGLAWPRRRLVLAAVLFALWPPVEFGLKLGQSSLLVWLLVLGALVAAGARRPSLSGILLALALVKPQLALLFAAGLAGRAARGGQLPRLLLAGGLTLVALAAAVAVVAPGSYADLLALRPRPWDYWGSTVALPSLLGAALGSRPTGIALYLPVALVGAAALLRQWMATRPCTASCAAPGRPELAYLGALTACATLLLTPYAYPYDAILLQLPLFWLVARLPHVHSADRRAVGALAAVVLLALWLLERPGDYTAWRFLGLIPPLALLALVVAARRGIVR